MLDQDLIVYADPTKAPRDSVLQSTYVWVLLYTWYLRTVPQEKFTLLVFEGGEYITVVIN